VSNVGLGLIKRVPVSSREERAAREQVMDCFASISEGGGGGGVVIFGCGEWRMVVARL
jgi:hypothetical protein